jgi:predicted nucleotide-binding protein (sugar kinase/HSP70/actin superfamily)
MAPVADKPARRVDGIPRGLYYYRHYPMWEAFFRELGADVLLSPPTDRRILDRGVETCVGEACLPVKVYFGHVARIAGDVDFLFVPRYTSIRRREYICPKFGGLPDMVRAAFSRLPPLIDAEINLRDSEKAVFRAVDAAAAVLGAGRAAARRAYAAARAVAGRWPTGPVPSSDGFAEDGEDACVILLMGHPYLVHDAFLNMGVMSRIAALGGRVITLDMLDERRLRAAAVLPKPMFWSYGTEALGCACKLATGGGAQGVIFLTSFGCGVDSFVGAMAERRIRTAGIPFAVLTLDELTAQAGLQTRIEAFLDTIRLRRSRDRHLSAHG